jgi:hypothetical protein
MQSGKNIDKSMYTEGANIDPPYVRVLHCTGEGKKSYSDGQSREIYMGFGPTHIETPDFTVL